MSAAVEMAMRAGRRMSNLPVSTMIRTKAKGSE